VEIQDVIGLMAMMRPNQIQPPFNNPAFRRALMGAVNQDDYMTAVAGNDRTFWKDHCGFFLPGSPMASDAGMQALDGPRDLDRVKREIAASGYKGEKIVVLGPTDIERLNAMSQVTADVYRRLGLNVDYLATDWGTVIQRLLSREPPDRDGW